MDKYTSKAKAPFGVAAVDLNVRVYFGSSVIKPPKKLKYPTFYINVNTISRHIDAHKCDVIGFGGLGVACWPLVPKFAGSNPAEASARLPSEGK
jgi:hypothetical protein